ncbi:hypothetical protein LZ554_006041 [Drepanopeziza brunnea f. sp. 'monogermtubi']|nr:hypothetical protein LZ554_006041 [Drepanopeziza brunnea f. sp. 'monogermtubi']
MQFSLSTVLVLATAMLAVNASPLAQNSELQETSQVLAPRRVPLAALANGRGFNKFKSGLSSSKKIKKKTKNHKTPTSSTTPQHTEAPEPTTKMDGLCDFLRIC